MLSLALLTISASAQAPGTSGGSCSPNTTPPVNCAQGLVCVYNQQSGQGTCKQQGSTAAEGQPCNANANPAILCAAGLVCLTTTGGTNPGSFCVKQTVSGGAPSPTNSASSSLPSSGSSSGGSTNPGSSSSGVFVINPVSAPSASPAASPADSKPPSNSAITGGFGLGMFLVMNML